MNWLAIISLGLFGFGILCYLLGLGFYINLFFNSNINLTAGVVLIIVGTLFNIFGLVGMILAKSDYKVEGVLT